MDERSHVKVQKSRLGRSRLSYSRRMRLDVILARRVSPYLYFRILLRTVSKVVRGYDAC